MGFLLFAIPCLSLIVSSFLSRQKLELEKKKKDRQNLFDSLLVPVPKMIKENNSIIITLKVPSQKFFNEMAKNQCKQ